MLSGLCKSISSTMLSGLSLRYVFGAMIWGPLTPTQLLTIMHGPTGKPLLLKEDFVFR